MGRCRCLSKPIKRFFFAYADKISEKWIIIVSRKYTLKYINKLNKLNYELDSSQYHHNYGLNLLLRATIDIMFPSRYYDKY